MINYEAVSMLFEELRLGVYGRTYHSGNSADQEYDAGNTSSQQSDRTASETKALEDVGRIVYDSVYSCITRSSSQHSAMDIFLDYIHQLRTRPLLPEHYKPGSANAPKVVL